MKVKCITTSYWPDNYQCSDLSDWITVDKIYDTLPNPASKWVWNIIDDTGRPHDIGKECFITLREINLDIILDK